jgi:signal transduction histidine kinase
MSTEEENTRSEREQTDESLRVERERSDQAVGEELTAIDEAADVVISLARARADAVLAAARAKTDRQAATSPESATSPQVLKKERVREDRALRDERAEADEALRDERAEKVTLLTVEREETDKDLLSERARSDDAIATRDDFLGIVSHDLQNMLTSMVGFAALIEHEVSRDDHVDKVRVHAQRILRSGARMNRLIGDLVDVASIEAGTLAMTPEVEDPTHVVTEALDSFQAQAAASGISLVAEIVPPPPPALFDPARILQVLTNLLGNAIKFTPLHGAVSVRVERVGTEVRFAVSDTGAGIAANKLEAVFERFVQLARNDRRGVGLGLYISRCIVEAHGGRIWAESTIGKGSTFCFTLPLHVAREATKN